MQTAEIDTTMPAGKWAFDESVTAAFEDMLARSIPQYEIMRSLCFDLGKRFVQPKTAIVDLGCSRGEALTPFINAFGAYNQHIGVEVSAPMLEAARQRFKGYIDCGIVSIQDLDLRRQYPSCKASLTLAILTLQFTPIEYRQQILSAVFKHTLPGGAFILVEKVLGNSAELDTAMVERYYKLKAEHGYTQEAIERKRLSLEGVLVPVTAKWNEELLNNAGFRQVDCFWRWMNFAAWLAIKD